MDWKLMLTTFLTLFVAELGDKTQLATLSLASAGSSRWTVFVGASLALIAASALAVIAGDAVGRLVPATLVRRAAGVLFIVIGVVFLLTRPEAG